MLKTRIITAFFLLVAFLSALFWLPQFFWLVLCSLISGGAAWEWGRLTALNSKQQWGYAIIVGIFCMSIGYFSGLSGKVNDVSLDTLLIAFLLSAVFWLGCVPWWLVYKWKLSLRVAAILTGAIVILPAGLALAYLRLFGPWFLLIAMAAIWIADIAAYFTGRAFGKHKLAPSISPGKTWEGALGAVVAVSLFGYCLVLVQRGFHFSLWELIAIGVGFIGLTALSIGGDLFESLLKRQAGLKDSSNILPGHGGILDRIDSLTSTLPLVGLITLLFLR